MEPPTPRNSLLGPKRRSDLTPYRVEITAWNGKHSGPQSAANESEAVGELHLTSAIIRVPFFCSLF